MLSTDESATPGIGRHERRRRETRAALVRAATSLFAGRGYAAVTMDELAAEADVSRATVYLHFATKADVARAVIDELGQRAAELDAGFEGPVRTRRDVEALVRAWVRFYAANLDAFRAWHEASAAEPALEPPLRVAGSPVVARLVGTGAVEPTRRAQVLTAMTIAVFERLLYGWLVQGWDVEEDDVVEEVVAAWQGWFLPRLRKELGPGTRAERVQ